MLRVSPMTDREVSFSLNIAAAMTAAMMLLHPLGRVNRIAEGTTFVATVTI